LANIIHGGGAYEVSAADRDGSPRIVAREINLSRADFAGAKISAVTATANEKRAARPAALFPFLRYPKMT
jgi:hypothetical protein